MNCLRNGLRDGLCVGLSGKCLDGAGWPDLESGLGICILLVCCGS